MQLKVDNYQLSGTYYPKPFWSTKQRVVVIFHGSTRKAGDHIFYRNLAAQCWKKGIHVFIYDFSNFNRSDRINAIPIMPQQHIIEGEVIIKAIRKKLNSKESDIAIIGHSYGANIALAVGARCNEVKKMVLVDIADWQKRVYSQALIRLVRYKHAVTGILDEEFAAIFKPLFFDELVPLVRGNTSGIIIYGKASSTICTKGAMTLSRMLPEFKLRGIPYADHFYGFTQENNWFRALCFRFIQPSVQSNLIKALLALWRNN